MRNGHTKDQLPKYGDSYYLKDGQEFILMLYNPTQRKVAAKIFINGRAESSMLVLKPGQRAWIERFLDTDRRFLFETYEVDDTPEGRNATADNGRVRVEFYYETVPQPQIVYVEKPVYIPYNPYPQQPWVTPGIYYSQSAGTIQGINGAAHATMDSVNFSCNVGSVQYSSKDQGLNELLKDEAPQMETGRVEMGAKSNQQFGTSYDSFESSWFHAEEFRLMPERYRPAESVKVHCTQCNKVKKPGDVFCSRCGTRY